MVVHDKSVPGRGPGSTAAAACTGAHGGQAGNDEQGGPPDFRSSIEMIFDGDPDGFFNAANDLRRMSASDAVEVLYVLAIEHGVREAHLNYGFFLEEEARPTEAIAQYEKAHALGDPKAAFALGQAHLGMGNPREAMRWFRFAEENPWIPLRLARAYRALGEEALAVEVLLDGSGKSAEAAVELVTTTDELDLDEAIRLLETHLKNGELDVLIPLADLYSRAGRKDREIELLRRSVEAGEPNALHNLGLALWEAGHTKAGRSILKQAAGHGDRLSARVLRDLKRQRHVRLK